MLNEEFQKIPSSYLFSDIAKKVGKYQEAHPGQQILRLGIGDVTLPLAPAVVAALHEAVDEQASSETFAGYGPERTRSVFVPALQPGAVYNGSRCGGYRQGREGGGGGVEGVGIV